MSDNEKKFKEAVVGYSDGNQITLGMLNVVINPFGAQDAAYQASVLPAGVKRVAIEAAHPMSWYRWVGTDGAVVGIETFGASAPFQKLYEEYGITAGAVVKAVRSALAEGHRTGDLARPGQRSIGTRAMGDAVVAAL